jgi:hypothetical protein
MPDRDGGIGMQLPDAHRWVSRLQMVDGIVVKWDPGLGLGFGSRREVALASYDVIHCLCLEDCPAVAGKDRIQIVNQPVTAGAEAGTGSPRVLVN